MSKQKDCFRSRPYSPEGMIRHDEIFNKNKEKDITMIKDSELDNIAKFIGEKLTISINQVKMIYYCDKSHDPDYIVCSKSNLELSIITKARKYLKEFDEHEDKGDLVPV